MTEWASMTYDEQRALLGLPDVRAAVERARLERVIRNFGAALDRLAAGFDDVGRAAAGGIAAVSAAFTPPPAAGDYGRAG